MEAFKIRPEDEDGIVQDMGTINELCSQRASKEFAKKVKAQNKNVMVKEHVDRFTTARGPNAGRLMPLENIKKGSIVNHMEDQLKLVTLKQYTHKDKLSENFVYVYDQEDKLQSNYDRKVALNKRYTTAKDGVVAHQRPSTT